MFKQHLYWSEFPHRMRACSGEEADEDPLAAELAAERSRAAHARSAALGAELGEPGGEVADVSRRFSYYALEGATGAVRWRHDVRAASHAPDALALVLVAALALSARSCSRSCSSPCCSGIAGRLRGHIRWLQAHLCNMAAHAYKRAHTAIFAARMKLSV